MESTTDVPCLKTDFLVCFFKEKVGGGHFWFCGNKLLPYKASWLAHEDNGQSILPLEKPSANDLRLSRNVIPWEIIYGSKMEWLMVQWFRGLWRPLVLTFEPSPNGSCFTEKCWNQNWQHQKKRKKNANGDWTVCEPSPVAQGTFGIASEVKPYEVAAAVEPSHNWWLYLQLKARFAFEKQGGLLQSNAIVCMRPADVRWPTLKIITEWNLKISPLPLLARFGIAQHFCGWTSTKHEILVMEDFILYNCLHFCTSTTKS